jgi:hypothetical protein
MGRKKINQRARKAREAIEKAMQDHRFEERLAIIASTLSAHERKRLQAKEQGDSSAAFPDWNWRDVTFDQGRTFYSGPYYDLRELCDSFELPWPESCEIIAQLVTGLPVSKPSEPPFAHAWRAWRMAKSGFQRPRQDEIVQAKDIVGEYTPQGRKRNFSNGLTQDTIACIMDVDVRTVRQWIKDCRQYAQVGILNEIASLAELSGRELITLMIERLWEEKPEE